MLSIFSCHECIIKKETEDGFFVVYRIYKISDELKCIRKEINFERDDKQYLLRPMKVTLRTVVTEFVPCKHGRRKAQSFHVLSHPKISTEQDVLLPCPVLQDAILTFVLSCCPPGRRLEAEQDKKSCPVLTSDWKVKNYTVCLFFLIKPELVDRLN